MCSPISRAGLALWTGLFMAAIGCGGGGLSGHLAQGDDAAVIDAHVLDAGRADAHGSDAGRPDSGRPDSGHADAGRPDSGRADASIPDASPGDAWAPDAWAPDASTPVEPACERSICLTGAVFREDSSNSGFAALCDSPDVPGLIPACDDDGCYSTFETFLPILSSSTYPFLFAALDTNADGTIDELDTPCRLNILGFSWGGVEAVELAQMYVDDPNVADARKTIDRLLVMDPFQPTSSGVTVPAEVVEFREYRHSIPPETDCSNGAPLGPYLGVQPYCHSSSDCLDYDYSLNPDDWFAIGDGSVGYYGRVVGHCEVPEVAARPILGILNDIPYDNVPTAYAVPEP